MGANEEMESLISGKMQSVGSLVHGQRTFIALCAGIIRFFSHYRAPQSVLLSLFVSLDVLPSVECRVDGEFEFTAIHELMH